MDKLRAQRLFEEIRANATTIGGWSIIDLAGNGKSAVVFFARRGEQDAALKIMDPEIVERFGRDSQKARLELQKQLIGVSHPSLVRIFDAGECETTGYLYVVMESLRYGALSDKIGNFPKNHVFPLIQQVASAARFLEQKGLAHRDIKPENIVVSDDFSHAVLLDLGVLKPTIDCGDNGTGGELVGTLRYCPPEFALGTHEESQEGFRAITFYQLGGVLHDMIMGRPLFKDYELPFPRLCHAIQSVDAVIESSEVHELLQLLTRHCLFKSPEARLRLVGWGRFEEDPVSNQLASVKEQLRHHIISSERSDYQVQPQVPSSSSDAVELVMPVLRSVCVSSPLFPPISITKVSTGSADLIELKTGPSKEHALPSELVLSVVIEFDSENQIILLHGRAHVQSLGSSSEAEGSFRQLCCGTIDTASVREPLDTFAHQALLAAVHVGAGFEGSVSLIL